jgi:hypothetical protein
MIICIHTGDTKSGGNGDGPIYNTVLTSTRGRWLRVNIMLRTSLDVDYKARPSESVRVYYIYNKLNSPPTPSTRPSR